MERRNYSNILGFEVGVGATDFKIIIYFLIKKTSTFFYFMVTTHRKEKNNKQKKNHLIMWSYEEIQCVPPQIRTNIEPWHQIYEFLSLIEDI